MSSSPKPPHSPESVPESIQSGPASPPYHPSNPHDPLPPIYASRSNLATAAPSTPNDDHMLHDAAVAAIASGDANSSDSHPPGHAKAAQHTHRSAQDHGILADSAHSSAPNSRPGTAGPRVAITDPLADFRDRHLEKPAGLGPKSDFPPHQTNRAPGAFNYKSNAPYRPPFVRQDSEVSSTDGGNDRDYGDIDWSDEEDLDEAVRFENEQAKQIRMGRLSLWKILNFLATTFLGNLIISACLLVPVIVFQYVYRRRGPDEGHRDYVADNVQAWFIWAAFNLHVEWWIHLLVELFPKAVLGLIQLVWGRPSQRVLSLAEYFNAIKGYIKLVAYAALSWGSWAIIFNSIYGLYNHSDPRASRAAYLYRIYQVIEFFFFLTLTLCVEKIIIKHIAMSFHRSAYADRIAKVTKSLKVFDWLRDHKPKLKGRDATFGLSRSARASPSASGAATPVAPGDFALDRDTKASRNVSDSSNNSWFKKHSKKRPSDQQSAYTGINDRAIDPATGKPAEGQAPARGDGRSNIIARAAARGGRRMRVTAGQASTLARVAMNDPFGLLRNEALGIGTDVNSPAEAKRLARSIFVAFRGTHKRSYLIPSDFEPAYPNPEDARDAFSVFDRDGNGDISQSEIKNTVMQVYKERRFLSRSMQDVNHAVGQLDGIFLVVALVVVMFEAFAIFNINIGKTLTTFYSLAIAFAFVFKESAANVFDSIIFIFITHPFDTGDRIQIGDAVLVVKRMSLLSCLFTDSLNQDVYISNVILSATSILNMRRSGYQWEAITAQFDFNTPLEKLDALEEDLIHWLQTEPERLFVPSTAIVPQKIEYMRSIECTIGMTHADTWQDWGRRFYRKNAFFAAFAFYAKKHGIRYANPVQPIVYWTEDAASLPPSYDPSDPRSTAPRRQDSLTDEQDNGYILDDFTPSPYSSPQIRAAGGAVALPSKKPKSFMNFTPPPDELEADEANVRMRKARRDAKKFANQGGDGG